jgi:stage V sporulation protein S
MATQLPHVSLPNTPSADAPSCPEHVTGAAPPARALKVSASSKPALVAGAIAGVVRERGRVELQAIGAAAINQAIKAVAIARGYVAQEGIDLVCVPGFVDVVVGTEVRTAISLVVERR